MQATLLSFGVTHFPRKEEKMNCFSSIRGFRFPLGESRNVGFHSPVEMEICGVEDLLVSQTYPQANAISTVPSFSSADAKTISIFFKRT